MCLKSLPTQLESKYFYKSFKYVIHYKLFSNVRNRIDRIIVNVGHTLWMRGR